MHIVCDDDDDEYAFKYNIKALNPVKHFAFENEFKRESYL